MLSVVFTLDTLACVFSTGVTFGFGVVTVVAGCLRFGFRLIVIVLILMLMSCLVHGWLPQLSFTCLVFWVSPMFTALVCSHGGFLGLCRWSCIVPVLLDNRLPICISFPGPSRFPHSAASCGRPSLLQSYSPSGRLVNCSPEVRCNSPADMIHCASVPSTYPPDTSVSTVPGDTKTGSSPAMDPTAVILLVEPSNPVVVPPPVNGCVPVCCRSSGVTVYPAPVSQ